MKKRILLFDDQSHYVIENKQKTDKMYRQYVDICY
jgi:hypothetical protein